MKTVFDRQKEQYRNRRKELRAQEKAERRHSRQWLWLVAGVVIAIIIVYLRSK